MDISYSPPSLLHLLPYLPLSYIVLHLLPYKLSQERGTATDHPPRLTYSGSVTLLSSSPNLSPISLSRTFSYISSPTNSHRNVVQPPTLLLVSPTLAASPNGKSLMPTRMTSRSR